MSKYKDDGIYYNFRLSQRNSEHMKIHNYLSDFNPRLFKSKNQFITEAILYYIEALEGADTPLTRWQQEKQDDEEKPITNRQFEERSKQLKQEILQHVDYEVMEVIIKALMNGISGIKQSAEPEYPDEKNEKNPVDEKLVELARSWS